MTKGILRSSCNAPPNVPSYFHNLQAHWQVQVQAQAQTSWDWHIQRSTRSIQEATCAQAPVPIPGQPSRSQGARGFAVPHKLLKPPLLPAVRQGVGNIRPPDGSAAGAGP